MKTNDKIFTVAISIAIIITLLLACAPARGNVYATTARVVELDRAADVVTVEDSNGELWAFDGCEDWQEGDCVSMVMHDMGTASIYDDEIVSVRYSAWEIGA